MAVRTVIQIGHPALKAANKRVVDFKRPQLKKLVKDLKDTMYANGLIGMAAPQIGQNYQVFVTEPRETESRPADQADEFRVYINSKIVGRSRDAVIIYEACGSVLNGLLFGPVDRPRVITVAALNLQGEKFRFTADGILGRVIQHEQDHMQGIEFTEKVTDYKLLMAKEHYLAKIRNRPDQVKAQKTRIKKLEHI